jgi:hypothetical protein
LSIYATNLGISAVTQFASPAEATALPALVPAGQLVAATAALNLEFVLAQLLGTVVLAPLLVRTVGLRPLFLLTAAGFALASILYVRIAGIDRREQRHPGSGQAPTGWIAGLRAAGIETWRLIRSDRAVLTSMALQTLVATTVVVLVSIVPIYTKKVLLLPAEFSVAVFSPAAAGMFLSVRLAAGLSRRYAKPALTAVGFTIFIVLLTILGLSREVALLFMRHAPATLAGLHLTNAAGWRIAVCALLAGPLGFAYGIVIVAARAVLYERVPFSMQGRVFAFVGVLGSVASILPLILVGIVAHWIGPRAVIVLVAIANALTALYILRVAPITGGEGESGSERSAGGAGALAGPSSSGT